MTISGILDIPVTGGRARLTFHNESVPVAGHQVLVRLHNLSPSGMLIESDHALLLGEPIETSFSESEVVLGEISWTGAKLYGCQFADVVITDLLENAISRVLREARAENGVWRPNDSLGARLQQLRTAKGLSQTDIAERLGISGVAISNWESDRSQPRQHRMAGLAKILGVPIPQLAANVIGLPESLPEVIASSKTHVANVLGVDPANVKISIDL